MIGEILRSRVKDRLDTLGINPFEAERRARFKKGYLNDLLIGKKATLREKSLKDLATALECDLDFLIGRTSMPVKETSFDGGMEVEGIVEASAWRPFGKEIWPEKETLPVRPDPRFDPAKQRLFLVRDEHAAGLGINSGSVILALESDGPFRDGDVLVSRRHGKDLMAETTIRVLAGGALSARPAKGIIDPYPLEDGQILGLVISAIRVFGEPH